MTEFKKGMWVMVAWGGKGEDEYPALVIEVRSSVLEVIDLGVRQILGVPFDWATPMGLPRICDDDGRPLYEEWEEN
jgi:hypothetical protein